MAVKWLVGILMIYTIATIICGVIEYSYFSQGDTDSLFSLMNSVQGVSFSNPLTAVFDILVSVWTITQVIFNIILWNFSFFAGEYAIIKYVLFWPLSIGFFVSFLFAIRGTSSA
jgi:hypothetical protein